LERFYKDQHAVVPSNYLFSYFNNLGLISMKEEKPGQAKAYFLKAIGLARSGTDPVNVSRPMISLAELLISTGRLDSARQLLTEVVVHGQAHGLKSVLSIAHTFLGDLSLKQSDPDQALEHFRTALELAKERNDVLVQERVSKNIASIFQLKQRADSALFYLELHHRLTEISEKSKARQSLLQQDLESRLQEQEISAIRQLRIERTILGVVGGATIGFMFFLLIRYRRRATVERIEAQLREEKLSQEKQNLQESLDLKDKQLAAQVMHSLQKNEMISELVTRIKETTVHQPDSPKGTLGKMIREIESSSTEPWKEFEQRFQEVHAGFYERLMAKHPDLTANERRLCAFLRLDMSTKEISNITGQSVKAITQARFRLRAKLGIENPDISLFEVLLQI
jgi:tetratricopeptide (TPR) repeat protein/DNA-binding CsgD family transcriptional regulator